MKRKLLPILFVSIAVFFASCGNSFSEKPNNKTSEKAIVSFSTILNSDSASSDKTARATVVNPVKLLTTAIDKIELSIYTVEKGEEIPYVYDDSKEEDKNIVVFNTDVTYVDDKNGGLIPNGEEYAINLFEKAEFEFDPAYVYSFYVNLFCKDEADNYECVQSGKLEEVELQTGNNELTFETKFAEAGNVAFVVTWNPADEEQNRETYEARVSSVKIGLFTGDDLENLSEVEDFKMTEFEVQSEIDEEEGFVKYYFANYAVKEVPNGHYQICVELYDKKNNLLNRFYYPLWVYGYKSVGSKALFNDYTRHYFIEYVYDEDVNIVSGKEDAFVNYFTPNSKIYLPDVNCIEREGYIFQGWYTSSTFEDDTLIKIIDAPALANNNNLKDFVVYAKFIPEVEDTTTGSIIFNDENIGYTITMTIDEPFTLNSGSASFDIVLADGTDLVSSGILANALSAQGDGLPLPMVDMLLLYGSNEVNNFTQGDEQPFCEVVPSMQIKEPEECEEGECPYSKPTISLNPLHPLEVSGNYRIFVNLMLSTQTIISECFDITVENKINYEEDVTASNGNISENLKKILKNRQGAEITVKLTGTGTDYIRGPNNNAESATICQLGAALWNTGILKNNNVNLDLSELKGVTNVPEGVFYYSIQYSGDFSKDFSSLILPEGITDIGDEAFKNCTSLKSLTIPTSVESMAPDAFLGCSNLTNLKVSEGSEYYEVRKKENAEGTNLILVEKAS
ncbi:MAG: leucine-rich repeat domain-containing protein, partial [Treponema sp.]|nr:leucine-rich repeat domain-containing protein [Treponema sp.]